MDLTNAAIGEVATTDFPRILSELQQRVESLEASADTRRMPRSWQRRLAILEAIFGAGGHVVNGLADADIASSTAYYHRAVDTLFRDCWRYIVEAGKAGYHERYSWSDFWPGMLSVPDLEASAAVTDLVPRLSRARVLSSAKREVAPLLPLSRCDVSDRTLLLSALYQAAQVDPDQVENVGNDLPRPKQVVRDLGAALETSERGPALADLLSCSPYMILVVGRFIEAFGKWLLRSDEFSSMIAAVQTATTMPKKKNSFTRFHPYTIPEPVGRTITETIIARSELEQLRRKISWPLPHIVRPSCLEGEADFLYHLILTVIRGDDVLSCRDVLQSGATMAVWVGGLLVALGEYHNGDRKAVDDWTESARSQTT